jgi:hypothetical protein
MEYFIRLHSRNAKLVALKLKLTDKSTGKVLIFPLYEENSLKGFKNHSIIKNFDMSKLEVEYDYDTDGE